MNKMVRRGEAPGLEGTQDREGAEEEKGRKEKQGRGGTQEDRKRHSSQGRGGWHSVIRQKIVEQ